MGLESSVLNILLSAVSALVTLALTYMFNNYIKSVNDYRQKREDREDLERKKKEQDDEIILILLKIELKYVTEQIKERGYYTAEERKRYGFMFAVYKERGGNGEIEREFLKLDSLPYNQEE